MECSQPQWIIDKSTGQGMFVRCRKCYECLQSRSSEWVSRLLIERNNWTNTYFFTLTYNDDSVPRSPHGRLIVCKEHISTFVADLRSRFQYGSFMYQGVKFKLDDLHFKYYITAEYGSEEFTRRPHYHGVLYINCDDLDLLFLLFTSTWDKGIVDLQFAGDKAAGYVSKYLVKYDLDNDPSSNFIVEDGELVFDPLVKTFSLMSKGLGKVYLSSAKMDWHRHDPVNRGYIAMPGGVKLPMPRYFTTQIFDSDMRAQRSDEQSRISARAQVVLNRLPVEDMTKLIKDEWRQHLERVRLARSHYKHKKI